MRVKYLAVCASLLAMAACDGADTNPISPDGLGPGQATSATRWNLYTTQQPDQVLDATGGWEVGTRFRSSVRGRIIGFRFYRAVGETGTNYGRLWTSSGQRLAVKSFPSSGTGWVSILLSTPVEIAANTNYVVSVNTNTRQVKRGGAYVYDGHLSNGPLYSDGGLYGQPVGAFPTSQSASYFFVDVIFEEHVPKPDLVPTIDTSDPQYVRVTVCNRGDATAGASITRVFHWVASYPGAPDGYWESTTDVPTSSLAAGACTLLTIFSPRDPAKYHEYHVIADAANQVDESNEDNNVVRR